MQWLTSRETAERMRIHPMTLANWRCSGRGPRYQKLGNSKTSRIRYQDTEVDAYMRDPEAYESRHRCKAEVVA